jgi:Protein of unknown function (DUF2782)
MRHSYRILMALLFVPMLAFAAPPPPPDLQDLPEPPPAPEGYETGQTEPQPDITIKKRGEDTVEEYSINGQVYQMKITPPHGVPYYLVKKSVDGGWSRMDGPGERIAVPQWVIFTF